MSATTTVAVARRAGRRSPRRGPEPPPVTMRDARHRRAASPPSAGITAPVVYADWSEARNSAMPATSSAVPRRCSGMFLCEHLEERLAVDAHLVRDLAEAGRVDRARRDDVGPDRRAVLDRDLARQRDEPGLGRAVRAVALGPDEPEHRRGVDDRSAAAVEHVRDRGAARPEDRVEVRGDREVPLVLGALERAGPTSAPRRCCRGRRAAPTGRPSRRPSPRRPAAGTRRRAPRSPRRRPPRRASRSRPRPASSMSATAMRAPASPKRSAAARPCPDAPPVISATLPVEAPSGRLTSVSEPSRHRLGEPWA